MSLSERRQFHVLLGHIALDHLAHIGVIHVPLSLLQLQMERRLVKTLVRREEAQLSGGQGFGLG